MNIGFVGLGQMGAPMAANLAAQFPVTVYSRDPSQAKAPVAAGAKAADKLSDLAGSEVVFLCLPNGKVVDRVLFEDGWLVEGLAEGAVVVDTSTIGYMRAIEIGERLAEQGISFIDAPVSGMQKRAEDGTLTMMCGGDGDLIQKLKPQMAIMASKILHMGGPGSGQLTKLINQLLFDINAAALAEILPFAVKMGLDPEQVGDVVNSGTGRSYASEFFIPNMLKGEFGKGYPLSAAYKDLVSGAEVTARHKIPTPVLAAATATYQQALLSGLGDLDKGAMVKVFEDLLGVTFRAGEGKEGSA